MLNIENIRKKMNEIYEYFEIVSDAFPSLFHDGLSEEERGFYQLLINFYEEMGTGKNAEKVLNDFKEKMHEIYNHCRTIPVQIGNCQTEYNSEKENQLYLSIEIYFLPIRQKEIINQPYVM